MKQMYDSEKVKLEQLISATSVGTWEWDILQDRVYVNERWKEMIGYGPEDLQELSSSIWKDLMHPLDLPGVLKHLEDHLDGRADLYQPQFRLKHRDGHYIWIEAPGKVTLRSPDGTPLKMFGVHLDISANKQSDANLRTVAENLQTFMNTLSDFVFVLDEQGSIVFSNKSVENILGYSSDDLTGQSVLLLHPPEYREEAAGIVGEMLAGNEDSCPLPLLTSDGRHIPVETRVWYGTWNGKPAVFGLSRNLSEIVEARDRFQLIFNESPSPMALSSVDTGLITDVNSAWEDLTGYTRSEALGKNSRELGLNHDSAKWQTIQEKVRLTGRIQNEETCIRTKTGRLLDGIFGARTISSPEGRYILSSFTNISELRAAKKEIENRQQELDLLFSQSPDGIFYMALEKPVVWSASPDKKALLRYVYTNQRLTRANRAFLMQYGMDEKKMLGMTPAELFSTEPVAGRKIIKELFEKGRAYFETRVIRADGVPVEIEGDYLLIYDAQGRSTGFFGIQQDITAKKNTEKKIRDANHELQAMVETLQETKNELIAQERMAAVGQLAAGVAHNFNNILMGIMSTVEVLNLDPDLKTENRILTKKLLGVVEHAGNLVKQITDYGRIISQSRERIHLNTALIRSANFLETGLGPDNELIINIENDSSMFISTDWKQLEQVLLNLIFNARDAMTDGGDITIEAKHIHLNHPRHCVVCRENFSGDHVLLSVRDTGEGIPEDILNRIFEPFFTTKSILKGTGLGLSQVYGILNQANAHLTVSSKVGEGTEFAIYFQPAEPLPVKDHRLLVIENDQGILNAITLAAKDCGYEVISCLNSRDGLESYRANSASIDLVITDLKMPGIDGIEMKNSILDINSGQKVMILAADRDSQPDIINAVPDQVSFMYKPVIMSDLMNSVARMIGTLNH